MVNCPQCDGTGWRPVMVDGVRRVAPCDHGRGPGAAKPRPASPGPLFATAEERQIRDLILSRRGLENAITARRIIEIVWPETLTVRRTHEEQNNCERLVKDVVEQLREARVPVGASKGSPAGYYLAESEQDRQEVHDRLLREGEKLIKLSQVFCQDADLVELLGRHLERRG